MVSAEQLAARRAQLAGAPDLAALLVHLHERAVPLLARMPPLPETKALLSVDGGVCPEDGAALAFDPWSPDAHRCPRCDQVLRGERHDRSWARLQHLWLAERAAHLAALAAFGDDAAAAGRATEILRAYTRSYWQYPNQDNVLGPSRLFFSTYLESIWICNYVAAAVLLRESGALDDATARGVGQVADEAANLIGEFDEGFSNRQTWNNAALAAIAGWFEDEELARRAIEGPTGLVAHLTRGFGRDGMWYEGENYHLFALRGLLTGAAWAREAGVDIYAEQQLARRVQAALLAPTRTALPDFTLPARKDSPFGVSLAQPAYAELWEVGLGNLGMGDAGSAMREVASWLKALYQVPDVVPEVFESYLHDAPASRIAHPASRASLSWWSLLYMVPELPSEVPAWSPGSVLLESQGLAVLRTDGRYVSLECGQLGGGHGHPDRLHLTLHAGGVPWLADPGTGSYVARDLFWYRSTLAHNAPRLDKASQPPGDAVCEAWDAPGEWAWVRGRYGELTRTVITGPAYVLDVVELGSRTDHLLELPWHFAGTGYVAGGTWAAGELVDEFVSRVERFVPDHAGPVVIELAEGSQQLQAFLLLDGELLRAEGPGRPRVGGRGGRATFYLVRATGRGSRCITVLEPLRESRVVQGVRAHGGVIEVDTVQGTHRHTPTPGGWEVVTGASRVRLAGGREPEPPFAPLLELDRPQPAMAAALRVTEAPPLDGTLAGFDTSEPLRLELEDQYRRSEEAYSGPEDFSAVAYAAWDDAALYLAVEVTKPDVCLRPAGAPPLRLDNEPDDVHSDGVQVYVARDEAGGKGDEGVGYVIVPESDGRALRVRATSDTASDAGAVQGAWQRMDRGFRVTLGVAWPEWQRAHVGGRVRFDLLVNEMLPGRLRRAGQLVWSGGNGWVWLRGDRQDVARMGVLELIG